MKPGHVLPSAVLAAATFLVSACGGGGGSGQAVTNPPSLVPPPVNVNINDPTLTVALNSPVTAGDTLTLVWSDEFDAAKLDPRSWYFESGDGSQYGIPGWGNNELQWYLPDSAELRDGSLVITARRQALRGKDYTSARINTRDRFAFWYGRIEARMKLPGGAGPLARTLAAAAGRCLWRLGGIGGDRHRRGQEPGGDGWQYRLRIDPVRRSIPGQHVKR